MQFVAHTQHSVIQNKCFFFIFSLFFFVHGRPSTSVNKSQSVVVMWSNRNEWIRPIESVFYLLFYYFRFEISGQKWFIHWVSIEYLFVKVKNKKKIWKYVPIDRNFCERVRVVNMKKLWEFWSLICQVVQLIVQMLNNRISKCRDRIKSIEWIRNLYAYLVSDSEILVAENANVSIGIYTNKINGPDLSSPKPFYARFPVWVDNSVRRVQARASETFKMWTSGQKIVPEIIGKSS